MVGARVAVMRPTAPRCGGALEPTAATRRPTILVCWSDSGQSAEKPRVRVSLAGWPDEEWPA